MMYEPLQFGETGKQSYSNSKHKENEMSENEERAMVMVGQVQMEPLRVIENATALAKELAKVVEDRKLYTVIKNRKFVHVEGWTSMGAMLGVVPVEEGVVTTEDGDYLATVKLIRTKDGQVVGGASALCGSDEPTWVNRPRYARRSMATTRATGKAFRLSFSWIMKLAGYEPTPAEEMPLEGEFKEEEKSEPKPEPVKSERPLPPDQLQHFMSLKAETYAKRNETVGDKLRGLIVGVTEMCWEVESPKDREKKRHSLYSFLTGQDSAKDVTSGYMLAIKDWLNWKTDSGGAITVDPMAVQEANIVLAHVLKSAGQQELPS
jgi:hypothetical protein